MRASCIPPTLRASTTCAILLFATSCVSAQSPSTTTTTSHSTPSPSPSDRTDPNAISTGSSGLSNGAITAVSTCGGFVFVFCIAATLFVWNRRVTRDMPDVQELVLSGDEEQAGVNGIVQHHHQQQQRRRMAGPLSRMISGDGPYGAKPLMLSLTPPEPVYRTDGAGMWKKGSDASDDLEGLDGLRGLQAGRDWVEMRDGDEEAVLQAAVARVVSGKS